MENFSSCSADFHPSYSSDHSSSIGSVILDEDAYATVATSAPKKRAGRKKFRETRHPLYKGVRRRNGDKWVCEVREPKKRSRIWLGTFPTADMAARAHDVAAMALKGRRACLNFADSARRLPAPASCRATDIQKAAREAAESFRSSEEDDSSSSEVCQRKPENEAISPECLFGMDEEAVFGMPGLLASMAEGMLLSPPPCSGCGFQCDGVEVELEVDMSLWGYSI